MVDEARRPLTSLARSSTSRALHLCHSPSPRPNVRPSLSAASDFHTSILHQNYISRYFLADNTISIEEPRITNSGLTQGKFMRRLQVARPLNAGARDAYTAGGTPYPKRAPGGEGEDGVLAGRGGERIDKEEAGANGSGRGNGKGGGGERTRKRDIYAPGDFGVGEEVWIHGRRFRIVDADLTTRQWFERNLGRSLQEAEGYPEDGYGAQRAKVSVPKKRWDEEYGLGGFENV